MSSIWFIVLVLPHLKSQCISRAIPLEQLLVSSKDDDLSELTDLITNLNSVADLKVFFFKYYVSSFASYNLQRGDSDSTLR